MFQDLIKLLVINKGVSINMPKNHEFSIKFFSWKFFYLSLFYYDFSHQQKGTA